MKTRSMPMLAALAAAVTLQGCTLEPRYIKGDPIWEKARTQAYPKCPVVQYPHDSRINEEKGTVVLLVTVDGAGKAADAQLEKSSGYPALDAATLKHVKGCAFEPKTTNGVPLIYKTRFSLHWELWT